MLLQRKCPEKIFCPSFSAALPSTEKNLRKLLKRSVLPSAVHVWGGERRPLIKAAVPHTNSPKLEKKRKKTKKKGYKTAGESMSLGTAKYWGRKELYYFFCEERVSDRHDEFNIFWPPHARSPQSLNLDIRDSLPPPRCSVLFKRWTN